MSQIEVFDKAKRWLENRQKNRKLERELYTRFHPRLLKNLTGAPNYRLLGHNLEEIKFVESELVRLANCGKRLLVGPWLSEVGFELLYWIPFLRWFKERFSLGEDAFTVVSRGGVASWYQGITSSYVELFDHFSVQEFRELNLQRIEETGGQKHKSVGGFDREIFARLSATCPDVQYESLHPSLLYSLFKFYWSNRLGFELIGTRTNFRRLTAPPQLFSLPEKYIAVKFYFSRCFPENDDNLEFCRSTIANLRRKLPVVVMSTGFSLDDHADAVVGADGEGHPVIDLSGSMDPRSNLETQTCVVAHSELFVGTYGGFSYLAPFFQRPSVSFYSEQDAFFSCHLHTMNEAVKVLNRENGPGVGFQALDVCQSSRLLGLFGAGRDWS